jgi:8-oxo-dGTP pyrophosphatase MutT (NUDIX family)
MSPELRTSARVVVVDDDSCTLLVRVLDPHDSKPPLWITPGGSLEGGESLAQAAARELKEETGLSIEPNRLGSPVAVTRGEWRYRGTLLFAEDWYFGFRTHRFAPAIDGYTELEREVHGIWHWWTPGELVTQSEIVIPRDLHEVVSRIMHGVTKDDGPVVLPWTAL